MNRLHLPLLAALVGSLCLAAPATAGAPGRWESLLRGAGTPTGVSELGLLRTADGVLHVAWRQETSALAADIRVRSISAAGRPGPTTTAVSGWGLAGDPALAPAAGGGLRVFFSAGTPIEGLLSATAPALGSPWSTPSLVVNEELARARTPAVAMAPDGTPLQTWYSAGDIVVHRGVAPGAVHVLTAGGTNTRPNVVTDAAGRAWVSWCRFQGAPAGVIVQQVDPGSGAAVGAPFQLPGSVTDYQGSPNATCVLESVVNRREPLVARAGGGVYAAGAAGYPGQDRVLVWRIDGPGQVRTLPVAAARNVSHDEPALAAAPDGRVWVAWIEGSAGRNRIVARRSNRAGTVFGAPVATVPAGGLGNGSVNLAAQAGRLDLLGLVASPAGVNTLQHTQLLPGLTLRRVGAVRRRGGGFDVTFAVLDAGEPVAGARVSAGGRAATTRASGRATLAFRGGRVRAGASKAGYVGASASFRCC
jgi:hypothetical protein